MSNIRLGTDTETGESVYLTEEGRQLSAYIIGTIGTGKSTLLEQIAIQDMQNGDGLCFLDPHEEAAERILMHVPHARKNDVIFWDPADRCVSFGLNPFFCPDFDEVDSKADNFIQALGSLKEFAEIFESAPRMKSVLQNTALAFILNQGYTLAETPEFLDNPDYRQSFYPAIPAPYSMVTEFWQRLDRRTKHQQDDLISSSLNKLERFQNNRTMRGIFGQPTNAINFRHAMDEQKIIVVKLNSQRLGADNAAFIGAFIVWEIFQGALSRADTAEAHRPQFHLLADEFQTYMTTAFPSLIEQVRKFNVDVTVAHQRRDQLPASSRNAPLVAGNKVVFTVTGHDAHELAKEFRIVIPEPDIAGQQPKYAIVPNALEHLRVHGHVDNRVIERYNSLIRKIDQLYNLLQTILTEREGQQNRYNQMAISRMYPWGADNVVSHTTYQELEQSKQYVMRTIDKLLYLVMSGSDEEFYKDFTDSRRLPYYVSARLPYVEVKSMDKIHEDGWMPLRDLEKELTEELMYTVFWVVGATPPLRDGITRFLVFIRSRESEEADFYHNNAKQMEKGGWTPEEIEEVRRMSSESTRRLLPDNPDADFWASLSQEKGGSPEAWKLAWDLVHMHEAILPECLELAQILRKKPVQTPTGQYEPVLEKPRLYSDVEAEIANTLATLPRFTARCKLLQDGRTQEYTIRTHDRPQPDSSAAATATEIKGISCALYGRPLSSVEQEIVARLRRTPQRLPRPERKSASEETATDFWDKE